MWARGGKNPLLDTFDCPDPSTATPRAAATTTPLQALALLNNSFTLRMADHLAERLAKERPGDVEQAGRASVRAGLWRGRPQRRRSEQRPRSFVESTAWRRSAACC